MRHDMHDSRNLFLALKWLSRSLILSLLRLSLTHVCLGTISLSGSVPACFLLHGPSDNFCGCVYAGYPAGQSQFVQNGFAKCGHLATSLAVAWLIVCILLVYTLLAAC